VIQDYRLHGPFLRCPDLGADKERHSNG
jgi:hypothetical protein